jgi:hypothetical protein
MNSSYASPWTLRVYDALPGSPFRIGVGFTVALVLLFFAGRTLTGNNINSNSNDLRIALTQILMTTYLASAYVGLLSTARRTTDELSPVGREIANWSSIADRVGTYRRGVLPLIGAASYLVIGIGVTNITTSAPTDPWDFQQWNYDVYWHRATTVLFAWWMACCCYVVIVESARSSRLSAEFESLDLLNLAPYQPLVRQGLINALLLIGGVSVMSLLGVESRYGSVIVAFWIVAILLAWVGLMLPLRGIRKKIKEAKHQELDWCRRSLIRERDDLKSGNGQKSSIGQVLAYRDMINGMRNWPFDNPTLVRFALYLLIPLGSWLGGAFVERGLDLFLS